MNQFCLINDATGLRFTFRIYANCYTMRRAAMGLGIKKKDVSSICGVTATWEHEMPEKLSVAVLVNRDSKTLKRDILHELIHAMDHAVELYVAKKMPNHVFETRAYGVHRLVEFVERWMKKGCPKHDDFNKDLADRFQFLMCPVDADGKVV